MQLNLPYKEIREYIRGSSPESVVMIGCDSIKKNDEALYSTVVVIRNAEGTGNGVIYKGCKVFGASVRMKDYGRIVKSGKVANLRQRLMQEVAFALEAFEGIHDVIGDRKFEIHVDINEDEGAQSHVAFNEARGYIKGMTGKEPEFKPHALAASFAADAHAHGVFQ